MLRRAKRCRDTHWTTHKRINDGQMCQHSSHPHNYDQFIADAIVNNNKKQRTKLYRKLNMSPRFANEKKTHPKRFSLRRDWDKRTQVWDTRDRTEKGFAHSLTFQFMGNNFYWVKGDTLLLYFYRSVDDLISRLSDIEDKSHPMMTSLFFNSTSIWIHCQGNSNHGNEICTQIKL